MNENIKISLLVSIVINILLLGLGIIFIIQRGGLAYLSRKFSSLQRYGMIKVAMYDNPFYWDKKSHFEALPKSDSEIIFLGDSLTDLCEWSEIFSNNHIKNRGICGDTTDGVLNRINNIVDSQPKKLFLMIGINDLNQGVSVENVANNYQLIVETLKAQIPDIKIFVQSLLPINNQLRNNDVNQQIISLNNRLQKLSQNGFFQYVNLFSAFLDANNQLDIQYTSDGIHLNGQGYLVWKKIIEKYVVN